MTSSDTTSERLYSTDDLRRLSIALAVYLGSLFGANTLGLKVMPFAFGLNLSVGAFMFPVVFVMTDVIGEVYGKSVARLFVLAGFIATALFTLYALLALSVPWASAGARMQPSYDAVYAVNMRIALASLTAFVVAEYQDVVAFFFFKRILRDRQFWLRWNLSNLWSQLLDTALFMTIAFWGVYDNNELIRLVFTWWVFKVTMGMLYTPLAYAGVALMRGPIENQDAPR